MSAVAEPIDDVAVDLDGYGRSGEPGELAGPA